MYSLVFLLSTTFPGSDPIRALQTTANEVAIQTVDMDTFVTLRSSKIYSGIDNLTVDLAKNENRKRRRKTKSTQDHAREEVREEEARGTKRARELDSEDDTPKLRNEMASNHNNSISLHPSVQGDAEERQRMPSNLTDSTSTSNSTLL